MILRAILILSGIVLILLGSVEGVWKAGDWLYMVLFFLGMLFVLLGGRGKE